MSNKQIVALGLAAFLVVIVGLLFFHDRPRTLVSVDMKQVRLSFIQREANSDLATEELKKEVDKFADRVERLMAKLSDQENLIIIHKGAVIYGAVDVTDQIINLMDKGYDQ